MDLNLYILSILDSARNIFMMLALIFTAAGITHMFMAWDMAYRVFKDNIEESRRTAATVTLPLLRRYASAVVVFLLLFAVVPSRKSLTESYVMLEGKKVATAEGLTQAVQKLADIAERAVTK